MARFRDILFSFSAGVSVVVGCGCSDRSPDLTGHWVGYTATPKIIAIQGSKGKKRFGGFTKATSYQGKAISLDLNKDHTFQLTYGDSFQGTWVDSNLQLVLLMKTADGMPIASYSSKHNYKTFRDLTKPVAIGRSPDGSELTLGTTAGSVGQTSITFQRAKA